MSAEPQPFGFRVQREDGFSVDGPAEDHWSVSLPHQCDSWDIVGEGYCDGLPHAEAVAELERFISEARAALEALRERREVQ